MRKSARVIILGVAAVVVIIIIGHCAGGDEAAPEPTAMSAHTAEPPTATPIPTGEPLPMYVCGIDRCTLSGAYGEMIFESGINAWERPGEDRGRSVRQLNHGQEVMILEEQRLGETTRDHWFHLAGGGWINGFWLTNEPCTLTNYASFSYDDC